MRSEGYCSCLSVSCLSMLQLTPRLFVRPTNDKLTIYFTGSDNQFNLAVFSEYAPLQRSERCPHSSRHFYSAESAHAHYRIIHEIETLCGGRLFVLVCV